MAMDKHISLYIYGAGKCGEKAISVAKEYGIEVDGIIDTFKKGIVYGYEVVDIDEVNCEDIIVIAVVSQYNLHEIYCKLYKYGFRNIFWFLHLNCNGSLKEDFFRQECINACGWGAHPIPELQIHISDKCNLNCRGCTHFSPLFDSVGCNYNRRIEDIRMIKNVYSDVIRLDILGGEPLLNPDVEKYIRGIRYELPNTFIYIFTNGLFLLNCSDSFFKAVRDCKIKISISVYEPVKKIIGQISRCLEDKEICYSVNPIESKTEFNLPLSISEHSKYPRKCISNGCVTIADGRIARCPTLMYISQFNKYFNIELPTLGIYDICDFYDIDGAENLDTLLEQEVPLCNHCVENTIRWEKCDNLVTIRDFAVED